MKQRAKRLMALFMAGVFALSTCMTSGPYTVMATEAGTAGVTTPSEGTPTTPSEGSTSTPDNTTPSGTPEEGGTTDPEPEAPTQVKYGVNLPQTIHDVEYGTVKVNYAGKEIEPEKEGEQDVVKFDTEITDLSLLQITSENYNFSNITVENGQITIATATPKLGEISGLGEITVDENSAYTITNSAWNQWVEWTTSDEKVIITKDPEVTGTANVVAQGYDGDNAKTVYVKATVDGTSIEKEITVKKKNVVLSVTVTPENGGWETSVHVTVTTNPQIKNENIDISQGNIKKQVFTDENGKAQIEWGALGKIAQYTFKAAYAGNKMYYSTVAELQYNTGKENQTKAFKIEETVNHIEYSDSQETEVATVDKDWDYSFTCAENQEVADALKVVDGKIIYTSNANINAGEYNVVVSRENDLFNPCNSEKPLVIKVNKKPLKLKNIQADPERKYDGTAEVTVKAEFDEDELLTERDKNVVRNLSLETVGTAADKNANEKKATEVAYTFSFPELTNANGLSEEEYATLKNDYEILKNNYELPAETTPVIIHKKELTLAVKVSGSESNVLEREYTNYKELPDDVKIEVSGFVDDDLDEEKNVSKKLIDAGYKVPRVKVDTTIVNKTAKLDKEYINALIPDDKYDEKTNPYKATKNYKFDFTKTQGATLKLTAEVISKENFKDMLTVSNENSVRAYQEPENKTIYYGIEQGNEEPEIQWKITNDTSTVKNSEINSEYKVVQIAKDDEKTSWDNYEDGKYNPNTDEPAQTISVRLATGTEPGAGVTDWHTIYLKQDATAPGSNIVIEINQKKSIYDFLNKITFGQFKNGAFSATVSAVTDNVGGSGLRENKWSYAVVNLKKDTQFTDNVKDPNFENQIKDMKFTSADVQNENEISFGGAKEAGNFVIFVLLEDNVGNKALYGSNGVIVDITEPELLTLNYKEGTKLYSKGSVDYIRSDKVGDKDVTIDDIFKNEATEEVADKASVELYAVAKEKTEETVYSGIRDIKATVTQVNEGGQEDTRNQPLYKVNLEEISDTLEDLQSKYCTVNTKDTGDTGIIREDIQAGKSVTYTIEADVTDFAGNTLKGAAKKTVVLDTQAPTVGENTIDPEETGTMNDTVPCYGDDIAITTQIQEQNLDQIYISLKTDDEDPEIKTVEEWKKEQKAEVQHKEGSSDYTVTFKLTSEDVESRYLYQVAAVDLAGNWSKNKTIEFVVDGKAPDVKENIIEKTQGDDINKHLDKDVYYSNEEVSITTTVEDRFINSSGIQMELIKDGKAYSYTLSQWLDDNDNPATAIKKELGIKCVYEEPDSENKERKERTFKFIIPATKEVTEGVYSYQVTATDYANNVGSNKAVDFCIDVTEPEVNVTYKSDKTGAIDAGNGNSIVYLNGQNDFFTGTIEVRETNMIPASKDNQNLDCIYDENGVKAYRYTGDIGDATVQSCSDDIKIKGNQNGIALSGLAADIKNKNSWTNKDTTHTYKFKCTVEANYELPNFTVTDLAGNTSKVAKGAAKITLDWTQPLGTIEVTDLISGGSNGKASWSNKLLNALTFGLYGKNFVNATITSKDGPYGGSGITEKRYYLSTSLMSADSLDKLSSSDWKNYNGSIRMDDNRNYIVYEKVVDKAGNLAYYSSDRVIVDDQNPQPEVTITPTTPGWGKGVYSASDNPGFDVYVVDPAGSDGSCAGLAEIKCTITDRTTGHSKPVPLASFSATSAPEATYRTHVSIDPAEFYSNEVQVTVEAKDHSTNPATVESQVIKIDNKAPIVTFSFDKSDVHNGKYYNNDKTLTITVDERNFDESYKPQVTSTAGGGYSISGWSHNGEIHTATVTFSGDSDYTVTYDCYDLAGNKSNTEKLEEFTVDKTKPAIQVSYDNNNALNNNYYKDARTATITITEHNFNPGEVTVTTTAQLDGAPVAAPGVSGWSGSGDTHVATVSYSADADYTFTISATDLASNVSEPYVTDNFTVDQTKPTVEITNIEDHSANNGEVAPVVTLNDINFDSSKTVVHLTGANKGEVDTTGMYTSAATAKGQTLTFHNFAENMDDIYTLTAEATDKAGNVYSTSKMFSVNRDGSTYMYDSYTDELIKNGYTNDPKNLVVSEINVDTLTFQELTVTENGTLKTLEQDKDYEVQESGSEVSWKEYKYTINASNFEEEGDYNVSIYSEDRATNVTTNTSKSKDILFAVDKTSPVIALSNIEDGGRYKVESQKFTANVDDNMALDKVEYYVDGKLQQTFDASEVAAQSGSLELSVDSSSKFQKVSVKAYDKANNEATSADADVLVSASSWVQFYNNKPAFYGTIGGGVAVLAAAVAAGVHFSGAGAAAGTAGAAGAGGFFFLAGKKKKDEEETK